jgi:transposase
MNRQALRLCFIGGMVGHIGGVFDLSEQISKRLRFPPEVTAAATVPDETHPPASRWNLACIRATFQELQGYSLPGVSLALSHWGIQLRHGRPQDYSPDQHYREKEASLLSTLQQVGAHPGQAVALFLDEVTFTQWPGVSSNWCEQAPTPRPLADRKQSKYRRSRVVGALDASSGRVCFLQDNHIGGQVFARFLRQLDAAYPQAQRISLIWDNWPVHSSEIVEQTLAQLPRMQVVSLPTYAPWLNPIEKLWRKFRQEVDYLHDLADDWDALRARVRQYFTQFAAGSPALLRYVGLTGSGKLATALRGP